MSKDVLAPATLSGLMSECLRYRALHQGAPAGSCEQYERTYRSLLAYLADHRLPDVPRSFTAGAVNGWMLDELARGVSPRTVASRLAHLNTLGGYLVKQQLLSANPTAGIERPRFKKKPSKFLHPEELRALLSAECATHERVALSLFVDSMCRVSELVRANVGDLIVSGDQAALRVTVKGGDEKQVPVSPEVVAELQVYLACRGELPRSAPLLVNSRGQGWTRSGLSQRVALPRRGVLIQALPMVEVTDLPETSEGVIRQNARWYLGVLDDIPYLVRAWREEPTAFNLAQLVRPVANKVVEWPIAALVYPVTGWLGWYLAYHHEGHRFWFYMATVARTVSLLLTVRVGGIMTKALIEDLHPYLPRRVDLRRKSLKEKFLGSFRCQTYWLLASRGSWRVLWALARRGDYEPGKTDPVRRLSLARLGRGRDAGS